MATTEIPAAPQRAVDTDCYPRMRIAKASTSKPRTAVAQQPTSFRNADRPMSTPRARREGPDGRRSRRGRSRIVAPSRACQLWPLTLSTGGIRNSWRPKVVSSRGESPRKISKPPTAYAGLTENSLQKFLSNLTKVNSGNGSLDQLYFVDWRSCFGIHVAH
jgi:hypothetical protein